MKMKLSYKGKQINVDEKKITELGFCVAPNGYSFEKKLPQFNFLLRIYLNQEIYDEIIDLDSGEPYTLYKLASLHSGFAYSVKQAVENEIYELFPDLLLSDEPLSDSRQFNELSRRLERDFQEPADDPFEEYDIRVFRLTDKGKWYGLIMETPASKLGLESDNPVLLLQFRVEKGKAEEYIDNQTIYRSYHMNKKNWVAIILDNGIDDDLIYGYLLKSRSLVLNKK